MSLLEMLELDATLFFMISAVLEEERSKCASHPHNNPVTGEEKAKFLQTLDLISDMCRETDLHLSALYIKRLFADVYQTNSFTYQQFGEKLDVLQERISDELESVKILYVSRQHADLYGEKPHFGDSVAAKFPKSTGDIQEAANCLALERTTACVFHLMRVMESAVQYLGKKLGVSLVNQKNWANILDEVDKAIKALPTKSSRQKTLRNKYAESSAHLRMVKDAWRNDVMHPKETYTDEEAERVFRNVKDFMVHLATKL